MSTKQTLRPEENAWRVALGTLLQKPHMKQELAQSLQVHPSTLTRWVENKSTPHPRLLAKVLALLPEHQNVFLPSMTETPPSYASLLTTTHAYNPEISVALYAQVLALRASLSSEQDFWRIRDLILQHALKLFDQERHDTMSMLALCTTPSATQKVRSLRGVMCVGYPPVGSSLDIKPYFGTESLPGYIVTAGHPVMVHDTQKTTRVPLPQRTQHRSIIVFPLRQGESTAGTLMIASCTPFAFFSSSHLAEEYAALLSITCTRNEFFSPQDLVLSEMPPLSIQEPYLFHFPRYLQQMYQKRESNYSPLSHSQAEQSVWQQIEEELIQRAFLEPI